MYPDVTILLPFLAFQLWKYQWGLHYIYVTQENSKMEYAFKGRSASFTSWPLHRWSTGISIHTSNEHTWTQTYTEGQAMFSSVKEEYSCCWSSSKLTHYKIETDWGCITPDMGAWVSQRAQVSWWAHHDLDRQRISPTTHI